MYDKTIIQHNLTSDNLTFTSKTFDNCLISPSIGLVNIDNVIKSFGEIKLFSNNNDIMEDSRIYMTDIYSKRLDFLEIKLTDKVIEDIKNKYNINIDTSYLYNNISKFKEDNINELKKLSKNTKKLSKNQRDIKEIEEQISILPTTDIFRTKDEEVEPFSVIIVSPAV